MMNLRWLAQDIIDRCRDTTTPETKNDAIIAVDAVKLYMHILQELNYIYDRGVNHTHKVPHEFFHGKPYVYWIELEARMKAIENKKTVRYIVEIPIIGMEDTNEKP